MAHKHANPFRAYRLRNDMTREQLAKKLNVSVGQVYEYERKQPNTLYRLAVAALEAGLKPQPLDARIRRAERTRKGRASYPWQIIRDGESFSVNMNLYTDKDHAEKTIRRSARGKGLFVDLEFKGSKVIVKPRKEMQDA